MLINSTLAECGRLSLAAQGVADLVIARSPGGRDIASWVLAAALLYDTLAASEHVLFMNDSFVGPFDDLAPVWRSLAGSASPWWGATDSGEGAYHVQTALFALKQAVVQSPPSSASSPATASRRGATTSCRKASSGCPRRCSTAGSPLTCSPRWTSLRKLWLDAVPTKLEWFEALPDRVDELGLAGQMDATLARALSRYARDWYSRHDEHVEPRRPDQPDAAALGRPAREAPLPVHQARPRLFNPPKTPEIVRLKPLAAGAWPRLAALLAPMLPYYPQEIHPVLRMTREYLQD